MAKDGVRLKEFFHHRAVLREQLRQKRCLHMSSRYRMLAALERSASRACSPNRICGPLVWLTWKLNESRHLEEHRGSTDVHMVARP